MFDEELKKEINNVAISLSKNSEKETVDYSKLCQRFKQQGSKLLNSSDNRYGNILKKIMDSKKIFAPLNIMSHISTISNLRLASNDCDNIIDKVIEQAGVISIEKGVALNEKKAALQQYVWLITRGYTSDNAGYDFSMREAFNILLGKRKK